MSRHVFRGGPVSTRGAAFVIAAVLLSRLPMISAGYGYDLDGWRLANVAREIAQTGAYDASRLPGHPVQEYVAALLHRGGPIALNGMTALLGALGAGAFALSWSRYGLHGGALAAFALASIPAVAVNSTNSMDYVWALGLLLIAHDLALTGRVVLAGVFLGLATGCRITTGAMILPLAWLIAIRSPSGTAAGRIARFAVATLVVAAVSYLPVCLTYGSEFFRFHKFGYPTWRVVRIRATREVWGATGLAALVAVALWSAGLRFMTARHGASEQARRSPKAIVGVWLLSVGLFVAAFLRLPNRGAYLIPALPFVLLLLGYYLRPRVFAVFCAAIIAAPWVSISGGGVEAGPLLVTHARRTDDVRWVGRILEKTEELPEGAVVVAGHWLLLLRPAFAETRGPETAEVTHRAVRYLFYPEEGEVRGLTEAGTPVFMLPGAMERASRQRLDLRDEGAKPLVRAWDEEFGKDRFPPPLR